MHHALDIARIELLFAGPARVVMYRFGAVGRVRAGLTLADTEAVLAAQTRVRDRAPERVHAERGLLPRGDCLVVLARQGRKLKQDAVLCVAQIPKQVSGVRLQGHWCRAVTSARPAGHLTVKAACQGRMAGCQTTVN